MSNRMLVLVGLPGSGKSTISNQLVKYKQVFVFIYLLEKTILIRLVLTTTTTTKGMAKNKPR